VTILAASNVGESTLYNKIVETLSRVRPDIPVLSLGQDWRVRQPSGGYCANSGIMSANLEKGDRKGEGERGHP
jgi:hypothetical protein